MGDWVGIPWNTHGIPTQSPMDAELMLDRGGESMIVSGGTRIGIS